MAPFKIPDLYILLWQQDGVAFLPVLSEQLQKAKNQPGGFKLSFEWPGNFDLMWYPNIPDIFAEPLLKYLVVPGFSNLNSCICLLLL